MRTPTAAHALPLIAAAALCFSACGGTDDVDRQSATDGRAPTSAAAATPPEPQISTIGVTQMHGAFWAAFVDPAPSTLDVTETNGAIWSGAPTP